MSMHNSFLCNPHVDDCACDPKDAFVCNPYCVLDYCPTDGQGEVCFADPAQLVKIPAGSGFTLALKGTR